MIAVNDTIDYVRDTARATRDGWNRFWFTPALPHTLALLRILGGSMLLYTHVVWTLDLDAFFGPYSWISREAAAGFQEGTYAWSYLWWLESPAALWTAHILALCVFVMLVVGLWTRVTSVLAFFITVAYCYRVPGSLWGLDQVNTMISMYLMIGPAGAVWSVDRWLATWRNGGVAPPIVPSVSANLALRLLQVHLCIVYFFSGIGKMRGTYWWDGSAVWFAMSNLEYQSLDMTWMWRLPWLIALLSHVTVFWETFYCVLIWPRRTRPIMLLMAVLVHGGIAAFLGMITFGLGMIIANLCFVPSELLARWTQGRAGQGSGAVAGPVKRAAEPVAALAGADPQLSAAVRQPAEAANLPRRRRHRKSR